MVERISYKNNIIILKLLMKFSFGILIMTFYFVLFYINMHLFSFLKFCLSVEKSILKVASCQLFILLATIIYLNFYV